MLVKRSILVVGFPEKAGGKRVCISSVLFGKRASHKKMIDVLL